VVAVDADVDALLACVDAVEADDAAAVAELAAAVAEVAAALADVVAEPASTIKSYFAELAFDVSGCEPDEVCASLNYKNIISRCIFN
jgi:hypothetical protein